MHAAASGSYTLNNAQQPYIGQQQGKAPNEH
jgi:hypothetical protein